MNAYSYDENGKYVHQTKCQPNPVKPGAFLIPRNATEVPPPEFDPETEQAIWNKETKEWRVEDIPPIPESEPLPDPEPSDMERLEAQVVYTAMMTDTLLGV